MDIKNFVKTIDCLKKINLDTIKNIKTKFPDIFLETIEDNNYINISFYNNLIEVSLIDLDDETNDFKAEEEFNSINKAIKFIINNICQ